MESILADPEDIHLAEMETLMKKLAAAPSEYEFQAEREEDEKGMAECVAYYRERRRARPIRVRYIRDKSPDWNAGGILAVARSLEVEEAVARNLTAATLAVRYSPARGGRGSVVADGGSLVFGTTCFHVTAAPTSAVVSKCADNIKSGLHPVLLVPREQVAKSRHLAEDKSIEDEVTVIAIEDFLAANIIELSEGQQSEFEHSPRDYRSLQSAFGGSRNGHVAQD